MHTAESSNFSISKLKIEQLSNLEKSRKVKKKTGKLFFFPDFRALAKQNPNK